MGGVLKMWVEAFAGACFMRRAALPRLVPGNIARRVTYLSLGRFGQILHAVTQACSGASNAP
jgi:hypothetical protein